MLQWLEITFGCKLNSENIVLSNYQSTARAQTSAKTSSPQSGNRTRDNHPDDEAFSALTALCVTACTAALLRGKLAAFCYGFSFFLVMQVCESSLLFHGQNGCFSQVTACCLLCEEFCANTVSALEHSRGQLCFLLIFINRVSGLSWDTELPFPVNMCRWNVRPVCFHIHVCCSLRGFIPDGSFSGAGLIQHDLVSRKKKRSCFGC